MRLQASTNLQLPEMINAVYANCDEAKQSSSNITGTYIEIVDKPVFPGTYAITLKLIFPAGSHSVEEWTDSAITQQCTVKVVTSPGTVECNLSFNTSFVYSRRMGNDNRWTSVEYNRHQWR